MVTRRGFFSLAAAAFALDPERALWVPGARLISIPAPRHVFGSGAAIVGELEAAWCREMIAYANRVDAEMAAYIKANTGNQPRPALA